MAIQPEDFSASGVTSPAGAAVSVTPHDTTDLDKLTRSLYIGVTGDVEVNMAGEGNTVIFKNVPAGAILPIRVSRVLATNTSASEIIALS